MTTSQKTALILAGVVYAPILALHSWLVANSTPNMVAGVLLFVSICIAATLCSYALAGMRWGRLLGPVGVLAISVPVSQMALSAGTAIAVDFCERSIPDAIATDLPSTRPSDPQSSRRLRCEVDDIERFGGWTMRIQFDDTTVGSMDIRRDGLDGPFRVLEYSRRSPNVRMQRSGWDKVQVEATAAGR